MLLPCQKIELVQAVRNGSRLEQQCYSYEQWLETSESLLNEGFMVFIRPGLWSVLDSKGQVRFIKDDLMKVSDLC